MPQVIRNYAVIDSQKDKVDDFYLHGEEFKPNIAQISIMYNQNVHYINIQTILLIWNICSILAQYLSI